MDESLASRSLSFARFAWKDWHDFFEHQGPVCENPLLANSSRYHSFLTKWSVSRTLRSGVHEKFRETLRTSEEFLRALNDDSGQMLEELEHELRPEFGTRGGTKRIISVVSKVATFIRPERFVAWDTFARRGMNRILGRGSYSQFSDYPHYLRSFDIVWNGDLGREIRAYVTHNAIQPIEREPRFQRRVLDLYHMESGRIGTDKADKVARFVKSHSAGGN